MEIKQYALVGMGFSGRCVRMRMIDSSEREDLLQLAAREAGEGATGLEWRSKATRKCVSQMLIAVSKETGLTKEDVFGGKGKVPRELTWLPVSPFALEGGVPGLKYNDLFTAKDDDFLSRVYRQFHEVTLDEVDEIMGKAVSISDDA
jgi:hypothetical protein